MQLNINHLKQTNNLINIFDLFILSIFIIIIKYNFNEYVLRNPKQESESMVLLETFRKNMLSFSAKTTKIFLLNNFKQFLT